MGAFLEWIDKVTAEGSLNEWNVAVAGEVCGPEDERAWTPVDGISVKKIRRNNKITNKNPKLLNVGAVRDPKDLVIDIDKDALRNASPDIFDRLGENGYIINNHYLIRNASGYEKNPLLIIYMIDKDSTPSNPNHQHRKPLNAEADVIAFSITIPGAASGKNMSHRLQIKTSIMENTEEEVEET